MAIKRLHSDGATGADLLREARAAAGLGHPGVIQIHDILTGADPDDPNGLAEWIVMEMVDGPNLAQLLRRGPLELGRALDIGRQVADILAAAHDQGIVHRDLKTENVMLLPSGHVKVLDFGLARSRWIDDETSARKIFGTPRAMSPEQALGRNVDFRSDLFSLGVLLYELLSTRSPFRADTTRDTLRRVVTVRHREIRDLNPGIPEAVAGLVDHLLEKDPVLRPQGAAEVSELLRSESAAFGKPASATAEDMADGKAKETRADVSAESSGSVTLEGSQAFWEPSKSVWISPADIEDSESAESSTVAVESPEQEIPAQVSGPQARRLRKSSILGLGALGLLGLGLLNLLFWGRLGGLSKDTIDGDVSPVLSEQGISLDLRTSPGKAVPSENTVLPENRVLPRNVVPQQVRTHVFDDFEERRNVSYLPLTDGNFQAVENPAPETDNPSPKVGRYERDASRRYSAVYMESADLGNANDYALGRKVFFMDLYTDAPIGTKVTVQIENSAVSSMNPYPAGRHSSYDAVTTVQNAWQRLELVWTGSPDAKNTGIFDVNQLVLLFDSGSFNGHTYYVDNFEARARPSPEVIRTEVVADFEDRVASCVDDDGGPLIVHHIGRIDDPERFILGKRKILMDVYSSAPVGTDLSVTLGSGKKSQSPYPIGRHSVYQAKTRRSEQWETVTFEHAFQPDVDTTAAELDQLVFLFADGSGVQGRCLVDNVRIVDLGSEDPIHSIDRSKSRSLAQGKPVTTSSEQDAGLAGSKAVDGLVVTRWASDWSDDQWLYVDLEADYSVDRVVLRWETAFGSQYEIQVSSDAQSWTTVHVERQGNGGVDDLSFEATRCRYVRMLGVTRGSSYGYSLWELEVHGT